jgi:hypothetical protein
MALRWLEGFENWTGSFDLSQKYGTSLGYFGGIGTFAAPMGGLAGSFTNSNLTTIAFPQHDTWIMGVRFYPFASGYGKRNGDCGIGNGSLLSNGIYDSSGILHMGWGRDCDGVWVKRGVNGNPTDHAYVAHSTSQMFFDRWYYVELKVVLHPTNGSFELRINGKVEASQTGVQTTNPAAQSLGSISRLGSYGTFASGFGYDDWYLCDGSGSVNNNFMGDVRLSGSYVNLDGHQGWHTTDNQNAHSTAIGTLDGDTSYNYSRTLGDIDTFFHTQPAGLTSVQGVMINTFRREEGVGGTRQLAMVTRVGNQTNIADPTTCSNSYFDDPHTYDVNPVTGDPWTVANWQATQFGYKFIS